MGTGCLPFFRQVGEQTLPAEFFSTVGSSTWWELCLALAPFPAPYRRNVTTLDVDMQKQCPTWPGRGRKCTLMTVSLSTSDFQGCQKRRSTVRMPLQCGIQRYQLRCTLHCTEGLAMRTQD